MTETPTTAAFLVFRLADEVPRLLAAVADESPDLTHLWKEAHAESRAGVILWHAWHRRHRPLTAAPDTVAGDTARQIHGQAHALETLPEWEQDAWFGTHWPLWPLPAPHGVQVCSLALGDRAESLAVARILATA